MKPNADGVKLLRQVQEMLRANPEGYDQESWCNTACCIAGHVCLAAGAVPLEGDDSVLTYKDENYTWARVGWLAQHLMGLGLDYADVFHLSLFAAPEDQYDAYGDLAIQTIDWPQPFKQEWENAFMAVIAPEQRQVVLVDIAIRRIDHFIETGK